MWDDEQRHGTVPHNLVGDAAVPQRPRATRARVASTTMSARSSRT
jgi:hypothetical protein